MQRQDLHAKHYGYTPRQVPCGKNVLHRKPRKPKREKLDVPFNFRVGPGMADALREKAAQLGKDVSQYLRDVVAADLGTNFVVPVQVAAGKTMRAALPIGGGYAFADSEEVAA